MTNNRYAFVFMELYANPAILPKAFLKLSETEGGK